MGTPAFAAVSLERLADDGFEICGVFTQPDRQQGRGMRQKASEVKESALRLGLPVYQPDSLRTQEALALVQSLQPDVIAVVAYGKILPDAVLQAAPLGAVNLHGSLLPRYRGAAPIQWAVLNGDATTGVCTIFMNERMDAGDLIYSAETEIRDAETSGELYGRLSVLGAELLSRTLADVKAGTAPRTPQNEAEASYVTRLDKSLSPVDWNRSPREIRSWIYGLQPWPVATASLQGKEVKLFAAELTDRSTALPPGSVVAADDDGIVFACGGGACLRVTELQLPGKRRMSAADYLRGHPIRV